MRSALKPERASPSASLMKAQFASFVADAAFPCLGAKAAFSAHSQVISVYDALGSQRSASPLAIDLGNFVQSKLCRDGGFATFIAIFREPRLLTEEEFERLLWSQLQQLHDIDAAHHQWDPTVSSDPFDPHFSFSFGGQALYVVGLHERSSRHARRFAWPTLVFNPHAQFDRLRHDGHWQRMQEAIRRRDVALQGEVNPMLSDFGEQSEARQYSGRRVPETWEPPFRAGPRDDDHKTKARCPFHH
jgi:FPC/CPF motif-containing protein YcgG